MKKLLVVLMLLAFVAPAMADDTLDLSGAMRVRAWTVENSDYTDVDASDLAYWDQRMRIQGTVSPADGVKAVFRIDLAEDTWGGVNWEGSRYGSGSEIQVDRAYLDVTKGMFNVKAGQQYMGLGNNFAYDDNATGLQLTLKTPVTVRFGYNKRDENSTVSGTGIAVIGAGPDEIIGTGDDTVEELETSSTNTNDSEDGSEDTDRYFIDLGYKADAFAVNVFYAVQTDGDDASKDEPTLLGVMGKFAIGPVNVMAEFNTFGGSTAADVDYVGMQFIGDASMKFSDALTLGLNLIYSSGEDEADEEKITHFAGPFGSQAYTDLGPFNTDIMPFGADDVFDPMGTNSGAMGGGIYCKFMPMEDLSLHGQYIMLVAAEDGTDNRADGFDNGYVVGLGASYTITKSATLAAEYLTANVETIEDADTEPLNVMVARIQVNF